MRNKWIGRSWSVVAAPLLGATVALAGCMSMGPLFEETRQLDASYVEGMSIDVKTHNGKIDIKRADVPAVQITAVLKAVSEDRLFATRIVAEESKPGTLTVRVEWPDGRRRNREGCSFEILTPSAYGVRLATGNGAISIDGLAGQADLETSNGRITVLNHDGDVDAQTSNGRITFERIAGSVSAVTSNGRLRVVDVEGPIGASTSNGDVVVEMARNAQGPLKVSTSNGGVKLLLSEAFKGELVLDTSNGGVSFDTPATVRRVSARRNHAVLQFSDNGPKSVVSTSNGSIDVKVRGSE